MKARSITQPKDTMIEFIMQGLSEKLKAAGSQIENFVLSGDTSSATESIRKLTTALEDLAWQSYLTTKLPSPSSALSSRKNRMTLDTRTQLSDNKPHER